jgi:preprotein translocase subunit SecD
VLFVAGALCAGCDNHHRVAVEVRLVENNPADTLVEMNMKVWGGQETFFVHREVLLTEADVRKATVVNYNGRPAIELTLDEIARRELQDLTRRNVGRTLGVVINGRLQSTSVIEGPVDDGVVLVTGHMLRHGAERFCRVLERQRA